MIVDAEGNYLLEDNLRALVRATCRTPLLTSQSIAVDALQLATTSHLRRTIATPHELITALEYQIRTLQMANAYLRTQLPFRLEPAMKFVIKCSPASDEKNRRYWFTIVAANGETVAVSETYKQKQSAVDTIDALKGAGINPKTLTEDETKSED